MKKLFLVAMVGVFSIVHAASTGTTASTSNSMTVSKVGGTVDLNILGGLSTTNGDYGGTFLAGAMFKVDRSVPFRLGLHSGIMFGSGEGLPILVSGLYEFGSAKFNPYFGGSVGPVIGLSGVGVFGSNSGVINGNSVKLAVLLHPGIAFKVADALSLKAEVTMGGLTGFYYVAPMFGASVHL